jgi:tetratricopeptide (TPR) repeat protein
MAIKIDPDFAKAYNLRALAYFSLRKYDKALKDFLFLRTKFNDKSFD